MTKKSITAAELLASMANDPGYLAMKAEQDERRAEFRAILDADQAELVAELNATGIEPVTGVWDLVSRPNQYDAALDVLTSHLFKPHHPRIMAGIVRSLAMRHLSHMTDLWEKFAHMYLATPNDEDIEVPGKRGLKFALVLGMEALLSDQVVDKLRSLIQAAQGHQHLDSLEDLLSKMEAGQPPILDRE